MGLTEAAKESIYWKTLLSELGFDNLADIVLFNEALLLAENPVFHARSKHIDIRHHFIREALADKRLRISHVSSSDNTADMLTKSIPKSRLDKCIMLAGMRQFGMDA